MARRLGLCWTRPSAPTRTGWAPEVAPAGSVVRPDRRAIIDGTIIGGPDSATGAVLRLHDVGGDSMARRAGASAPLWRRYTASARGSRDRRAAARAPRTRPAGRSPPRCMERKPSAIAKIPLQGEQEYRRMHFARALEHYREAVREDSALALAAVKGAVLRPTGRRCPPRMRTSSVSRSSVEPSCLRGSSCFPVCRGDLRRSGRLGDPLARACHPAGLRLERRLDGARRGVLPPSTRRPTAATLLAQAAFEHAARADTTFTPPLPISRDRALARRPRASEAHVVKSGGRSPAEPTLTN